VQRKSGYIVWFIILIALIVLFLAWQYLGYHATTRTLPTGMTVAGIPLENMTYEQALNSLEVAFAMPLSVSCQDRRLTLSPHTVRLQYDSDQTTANLDVALADWRGLEGFLSYVLRRLPGPKDVPSDTMLMPGSSYPWWRLRLGGFHRLEWLEWEESAPLIGDVSTAAYRYFNSSQ
jgi:hypothetical protein